MITENYSEKDLRAELQERYMAKSSLVEDHDARFEELESDRERIIGQGYYRLAKVYYDKADLETAEDYFLRGLEKTVYPKDSFAMFKCYGFLIRIYSESEREDEAEKYIALAEELVEKFGNDLGSLNAEYFFNVGMVGKITV